MRRVLFGLAMMLLSPAAWASCPTPLPFTLLNGTVADAGQVMANFNNVWTCGINPANINLTGGTITGVNGSFSTLAVPVGGFEAFSTTGAGGISSRPTTWLSSSINGVYAYLATAAMTYNVNNTGEPGMFGASRTSDTPFPNVCCAIGITGAVVNDNTAHVQTAWPLYLTGARKTGTGSLNTEIDVFNEGSDFNDANPNTQPNGAVVGLAIQAGGEPTTFETAGADVAALLYLASNSSVTHPQYIRHGIVFNFVNALFNPSFCTTNCPILDTFYGTELRWVWSGSDTAQSFVRGNNSTTTAPNGIVMTQFGTFFENGAGGILGGFAYAAGGTGTGNGYALLGTNGNGEASINLNTNGGAGNSNLRITALGTGTVLFGNAASGGIVAQVVSNSTTTTSGYVSLSTSAGDAVVAVGNGNGATNANLQLNALGTGRVISDTDFDLATSKIYRAQGTAGVSCSGSPTASFASIGGIVTHC